jgi:hypothetical protein
MSVLVLIITLAVGETMAMVVIGIFGIKITMEVAETISIGAY